MGIEFLKFGDVKTKKREFFSSKSAIPISHITIDKIVTPEEFSCVKKDSKYFVSYKNKEEVTLLCVLLPKISEHVKKVGDIKTMCFLIKERNLLKKYNKTWGKIKRIMKRKNLIVTLCFVTNHGKLK